MKNKILLTYLQNKQKHIPLSNNHYSNLF